MLKQLKYVCFLLVWMFITNIQAQQKDTLKVLFVGNSYTYFWNLPQTVRTMAATMEVPILTKKSTVGGTTWKQHWDGDKGLKSRDLIEKGNWDVVILQNHSMSTINSEQEFEEYGSKFIDLVRQSGAIPVLYMTWAREFNPLMQTQISQGYRELGNQKDVLVVPVGEVWERARQLKPGFRLYDPDGSHPSTIGTYLTALVFVKFLTGRDVSGIPNRLSTVDQYSEELFFSIMSKEDVTFMQQLVDSFELEKLSTNDK